MYYVMRASAPSLHRESTDSLIICTNTIGMFLALITHTYTIIMKLPKSHDVTITYLILAMLIALLNDQL